MRPATQNLWWYFQRFGKRDVAFRAYDEDQEIESIVFDNYFSCTSP